MASDADSVPFYSAIAERLSQGDIIHGLPRAVLQHPLTICRPGGKAKQAWYNTLGDANPPAFGRGPEIIHAKAVREPGFGMVIWEDCQIDKMQNQGGGDPSKWFVAVAPVVPLAEIPAEHRVAIEEGRRLAFFPIKAFPDVELPAAFVDLRLLWPIQQQALTNRITTLSPDARSTMYAHLFRFLTSRQFPTSITCPTCATVIDPKNLLSPVTD